MTDVLHLTEYDDTPVYTIKTVVQQTGITPATLRAWERRYGVLQPGRSDGGYRLYSERDIAILLWLKGQVEAGVTISRAVALLEIQHQAGVETGTGTQMSRPELDEHVGKDGRRSTAAVMEELLVALVEFDEDGADAIVDEAFALYSIEAVTEEIIAPTLIEIGERWHRGEVSVVQEHFATAFLRQRLAALFRAYDQPDSGPLAVTGAAPGEWHDVGILIVSLCLRRNGWRVIFLSQAVPAEQLMEEVAHLRPNLVCISATTPNSAAGLSEVARAFENLPLPRPRFVFGGRLFTLRPELQERFAGFYLNATARDLLFALRQH